MSRICRLSRCLGRVAGVAIAACCTHALAQPGGVDALERVPFVLGDARYHIMMPKGSKLRGNQPGCVQIWHPHTTRLMKFLEFCSPVEAATASYQTDFTLSNGARVRYDIDYNIGGGSGGNEGELTGLLDIAGRALALRCRDQGEWGNDPSWCVSHVHTLEVRDQQ